MLLIIALKVLLILLEGWLCLTYLAVRMHGRHLMTYCEEHTWTRHHKGAKRMQLLSGAIIAVVLGLETSLRAGQGFHPVPSVLFIVHLACAMTFFTCIFGMYFVITGSLYRRVHPWLGLYVVPFTLGAMVVTGTILAVLM